MWDFLFHFTVHRLAWFPAAVGLLFPYNDSQSRPNLADRFAQQVDRRLAIPDEDQRRYAELLSKALSGADLEELTSQYMVLVDRNVFVQAVMIFWKSGAGDFLLVGASPASTGKPGQYEHFETPIGVFDHSIANPDFRAEGTRNELGILGYGRKGMRIYDFGWVKAPKGWGDHAESIMRLQMHATDPDLLERRLGTAQSKGCIRIRASLNTFIDRYGILDANYELAVASGRRFFVLSPDREPTTSPGRYLVVVDSNRQKRPTRPSNRGSLIQTSRSGG
jgi:hypothetical protein